MLKMKKFSTIYIQYYYHHILENFFMLVLTFLSKRRMEVLFDFELLKK